VTYRVEIDPDARAYLRSLDKELRRRMGRRIDEIEVDPYGRHSIQLKGAGGRRRSRVGDYRIIYRVSDRTNAQGERIIDVLDVSPRGPAYRGL
jgi:mRNA-degrading endonuclease RelE of RelBE toxin-antitoxin system